MSEITKLYENAGINQACNTCDLRGFKKLCPTKELCVRTNPSFTAEKQIKIIKWLAMHKSSYGLQYFGKQWANCCEFEWENFEECSEDVDFEQSLSGLINIIWQSLTDEEKQQIKEILE